MVYINIIWRKIRQVKFLREISAKILYKMNTFGENIKRYRLLNKLSQQKLGDMLGFSARTVSDWECNNTEPNIETIRKLVEILNITYEELFDF